MAIIASRSGASAGSYYTTDTYANISLITTAPAGTKARASDVGLYGSDFVYTGSRWIPVNGRCVMATLPLPIGIAPTFTGTTNGAITFGTAVTGIYSKCYAYYPAASLVAGQAAGFYYTEMSSTTAAVVYNNLYTPAAGTYPTEPTSKVAFSGAVPGGAGASGAEITFLTIANPAGLMGAYGEVATFAQIETNSTAGNKYIFTNLNASRVGAEFYGGSITAFQGESHFKNNGAAVQRGIPQFRYTTNSLNPYITAVNTAVATTISHTMQTSAATDWMFVVVLSTELRADR